MREVSGAGRRRTVRLGALSLATAAMLAAQGVTVAAADPVPDGSWASGLETGSQACGAGEAKAYVRTLPPLRAVLSDPANDGRPDAPPVAAEFELWWAADGGIERRQSTTLAKPQGSGFSWQLPEEIEIPADTVVSWHVRALSGGKVSPWSSDGSGTACEFVYDREAPGQPVVSSDDYPDNDAWTDGVGVHGTFHVDSPSDDVVFYRYNFLGGRQLTVPASGPDGAADIDHLPESPGLHVLEVQAFDRAGNGSAPVNYQFRVGSGRVPTARWKLADAAGSRTAAAETGPAARVGAGAAFGAAAPSGTDVTSTVALDGTGHGFVTPDTPVVATDRTFSVGAWVRPAAVDGTRTVVSQDSGQGPAFTLGLRQADGKPVWSFGLGGTRLTGGAPEAGQWAHVLGRYDARTGTARLYVNGRAVGEEQPVTPVSGDGDFQIGRAQGAAGYRDRWQGEIGDVRVYDRVAVSAEVAELAARKAQLLGHWGLETAPGGISAESNGGQPLKLGPGASIRRLDEPCDPLDPDCDPGDWPLDGEGHLLLDGVSGHATTEKPVVDTGGSFSVSATVRLADQEPDRPMTVLSQGGTHGDAFKVRYRPSTSSWELVMSHADEPGAAETVVARYTEPDGGFGTGHRIAVVHDDTMNQVTLYVDGYAETAGTAEFRDGWTSGGGLQVGRGRTAEGWGEYLHGAVDQVRAFSGALTAAEVAGLM
ncbi:MULTISPECIES: LamG domain-containing protein [unclassified Streptomyces]|uniref:LamG domain-containing protein n=1 Tax=unclassified Streptomyces TaxID=2593676 RepID=UPI0021CCD733|nr:LamG domain-containing protein [Streptomyces sp. sk2.1]